MAVYINYINSGKFSLFEKEENSSVNLFDVFNTEQIKNQLKELLFQKIPTLKNTSDAILNLFVQITKQTCKNFIEKITSSNLDFYESIKKIFEYVSKALSHFIFIHPQYSNLVYVKVDKLIALDKNESLKDNELNTQILNKMKEVKSEYGFEIAISDMNKINEFCNLQDTRVFTLENEDNYLCLPFDDEKKFKAIKVANYYDAYFEITDQESNDILDILLEHKEKGINEFKRKIGNMPEFTYQIYTLSRQDKERLGIPIGLQGTKSDTEIMIFINDYDQKYISAYSTFVHEFIHYKDQELNKNKFTNHDIQEILQKLKQNFQKNQIVSQNEIAKILRLNKSSARYLIAVLEKKGYIEYDIKNFTKIKMSFLPKYISIPNSNEDREYSSSVIELNTQLNDDISDFIHTKRTFNTYQILLNLSTDELDKNNKFSIFDHTQKILKLNSDDIQFEYNLIKFSDEEYKKIHEYFIKTKSNRATYKEEIDDLIQKFNQFKYKTNLNKFDTEAVYEICPDWQQQLSNLIFIKNLNFNEKQLNLFLTRFDTKKYEYIIETLITFKVFDQFYNDSVNLKFNREEFITIQKEKLQEFINSYLENRMNLIFNEIINANPGRFQQQNSLNVAKEKFEKNYKRKFMEKLNHYIQNKEVNKEKFDKLKTF